ncbi:Splicing factor3B subunit 6 [Porites harrisoni]
MPGILFVGTHIHFLAALSVRPFCLLILSGNAPETRGTAFVVYEDIFDAKNACDHLSGFNVCNRYLVVLYYQSTKAFQKLDREKKRQELEKMKEKYGINKDK